MDEPPTASLGQSINMPLLCPCGANHELATLFCPHSYPHSDPPRTPDGEQRISGYYCFRCDGMWMFEPWCLCETVPA